MVQLNTTLHDATEAQLHEALISEGKHVIYSYADIEGELEKRRLEKQNNRTFILSLVVVVSALSLIASVLVALFATR
jgi:hypothetical protein